MYPVFNLISLKFVHSITSAVIQVMAEPMLTKVQDAASRHWLTPMSFLTPHWIMSYINCVLVATLKYRLNRENVASVIMMTSSNGNIFRATGHLCGEFTGPRCQWRGALMFSLICVWINDWANNGEAGDLRRHCKDRKIWCLADVVYLVNMHVLRLRLDLWWYITASFPRYWHFMRGIDRWPVVFPSQRPLTRCFDVFFEVRLNKRFGKKKRWWIKTPRCTLWRH